MSDWFLRWNNSLREQHRFLFDYETRTIKDAYAQYTNCPVCEKSDAILWFSKDWFRWFRCRNCQMVYMNPRLNDTATHQFYNSEANAIYNESKFYQTSESTSLDDLANESCLFMIDKYRRSTKGSSDGLMLEIGSGKGFFLKKAMGIGYKVYGLELNQISCDISRNLLGPEASILDVDLVEASFPSDMFDVIYMRDLIQHIPDPKIFLSECRRIIKPDGMLFIGTHNIDGIIPRVVKARYTPVFGFMEPNHFSPRTITRILEQRGFSVRDIQFKSLDSTVNEILTSLTSPSFTTIFESYSNTRLNFLLRSLRRLLRLKPLYYIDNIMTPRIADLIRQGSWMNVMAEKRSG